MTNWHARVGSKLSTKVSPFLATGAATANAGTTFRMTGSLDFLEERDLGSFAEFIFIHARSLRNPFRIKWKGFTNVPSLFLDRLSRSCITSQLLGVGNVVRPFLKSNILRRCGGLGSTGAGKGNRFYYSTFIYIAPFIQGSLSISTNSFRHCGLDRLHFGP